MLYLPLRRAKDTFPFNFNKLTKVLINNRGPP
jgi:hypothetical protein